ncbi:MAG: 3-phosphoshikimate 1-carboxyvinyltransferase [Ilumatobacteraceae bacterium]
MTDDPTHGPHRVPHLGRPVDATVPVPGSKSISNRALVCAALADGESVIESVAPGDDTAAMVECLGRLGVVVELAGSTATVVGTGAAPAVGTVTLPTRLAGTTSRFLTALAALGPGPVTVDGDPPLRRRPMGPLHDALRALGVRVAAGEADGHLPVTVAGPPTGSRVDLRGDVSSQYVSALMMIGPALARGLRVDLVGPLVSRPYVELTAAVMSAFGADVEVGEACVRVGHGRYAPTAYRVEPDASSASYALALAAAVGGEIVVPGLGAGSLQGDARFVDLVAAMGCRIEVTPDRTTVRRDAATPLRGIDVDMADVSDLVPTIAVLGALAATPTRIRGVGFIRNKESDRLGDLATELRRAGAAVRVLDDGLEIVPAELHGARLGTHHDHRLAMAFAVLGAAVEGIEVDDPDVVSKSWPSFWSDVRVAAA